MSIMEGERHFERILVQKFWRGVKFILLKQSQHLELAEDLTQDTFILAIGKIRNGELKEPSSLPAFIRQIAVNLLIAHYRKEQRQKTDANMDTVIQDKDKSPGLYENLASKQLMQIVLELLQEMNVERDRELLRRYYIHEQNKPIICEDLQLSNEHFDRVLHRARERLKQKIILKLSERSSTQNNSILMLVFILSSPFLSFYFSGLNENKINFNLLVRESTSSCHLFNDRTMIIPETIQYLDMDIVRGGVWAE